jgi:hypothetical protein
MDERLLHSVQLWQNGYAPKVILSAKLAKWQTYEDYPSWRHAMKLKMFPEGTMTVPSFIPMCGGSGGQTAGHFSMSSVR